MYCNNSYLEAYNSSFSDNNASAETVFGSGICTGSDMKLDNCKIELNHVSDRYEQVQSIYGIGLCINGSGNHKSDITNCLITENYGAARALIQGVGVFAGRAYMTDDFSVNIVNTTIAGNEIERFGDGSYTLSSESTAVYASADATLKNSVVLNNTNNHYNTGVAGRYYSIAKGTSGTLKAYNSLFNYYDTHTVGGNLFSVFDNCKDSGIKIEGFSAFVNATDSVAANRDYHLTKYSILTSVNFCINNAVSAYVSGSYDMDSMLRTVGTAADMGAYEYYDAQPTATNFETRFEDKTEIQLRWKAPVKNDYISVLSYNITATEISPEAKTISMTVPAGATSATLTGLKNNTQYIITLNPVGTTPVQEGLFPAYAPVTIYALTGSDTLETPSTVVTIATDTDAPCDNLISLREAVGYANAGDTVTFAPALDGKTLALDNEIKIDKLLTISGNGFEKTLLDGNNKTRLFIITAGNKNTAVTIKNLALLNGLAVSGAAAEISDGSTPFTSNVIFVGNTTFNSNGGGGAVMVNSNAFFAAENCHFENNTGLNSTGTASGGYGGAIFQYLATVSLTSCDFVRNSATSGGAIRQSGGFATLTDCTFTENSSTFAGGAINLWRGSFALDDCILNKNTTSGSGGALYTSECKLTLRDTEIYNNTSTGMGGGIAYATGEVILSSENDISDNKAGGSTSNIHILNTAEAVNPIKVNGDIKGSQIGVTLSTYPASSGVTVIAQNTESFKGDIPLNVFSSDNALYGITRGTDGTVVLGAKSDVTPLSLKIVKDPDKLIYYRGIDTVLKPEDISVVAVYPSEMLLPLELSDLSFSALDMSTVGEQTITVNFGTVSDTFTVNVAAPIASLEISSLPVKTSYYQDEDFTADGIIVKAVHSDGSKTEVPSAEISISGIDKTAFGKQTLTVSFLGFTVAFEIELNDRPVSLSITSLPALSEYKTGEALNTSGLTAKISYLSGAVVQVPVQNLIITGFSSAAAGEKTVTVSYLGFSDSFKVNVSEKPKRLNGDVDGDGKITSADARLALRAAVKLEILTGDDFIAANVISSDNIITSADARLILRAAVKLENLN